MTARTAAAALMILGGIVIVAGSLGAAGYAIVKPAWLDARFAALGPDVAQQLDVLMPRDQRTTLLATAGLFGALEGAASIYVGAMVARARRWAIGTSIAITSIRLVLVAFLALPLALGAALGTIDVGAPIVTTLAAVAVALVATIALLLVARRSAPPRLPIARTS